MNAIILGGFLGSGKTTLLLRIAEIIAKRSHADIPLAIIENEIGAVGIDDKLIERDGYSVSTMLSGCACCTMAGELPEAVIGIERDLAPDFLIIEATGLAMPQQIQDNLKKAALLDARICVLVDAYRWRRMLGPLEVILRQQLSGADAIILNKVDLIDKEELAFVNDSLDRFNSDAARFAASASNGVTEELIDSLLGLR